MTVQNFMLTAKEERAKKMLKNAANCCKNMIFPIFLDVDCTKNAGLNFRFIKKGKFFLFLYKELYRIYLIIFLMVFLMEYLKKKDTFN